MASREELKRQTKEMWRGVKRAATEGQNLDLAVCRKDRGLLATARFASLGQAPEVFRVYTRRAVVVGVDVREWTRRSWAVQSMITAILYDNIRHVCDTLQNVGILRDGQPSVVSHTGDGAMLVFDCADDASKKPRDYCLATGHHSGKCQLCPQPGEDRLPIDVINGVMAFVYALNAITQQDNYGERFRTAPCGQRVESELEGPTIEYLPVYLRYALSHGRVLPVIGVYGQLECVGEPMVTCNRILSTDHGNHLLFSRDLLREIDRHGGLLQLGKGHPVFDWKHVLYVSESADKDLKCRNFRYADVFGYHEDGPLLRALGQTAFEPRRYQIGSHDTRMVD